MGRMPIFARKGAPADAATGSAPDDASPDAGAEDTPDDVETCPNCDCQFTEDAQGKPTVVKDGKPVQDSGPKGASDEPGGADLSMPDPSTGGEYGSGRVAAGGTDALTRALASVMGAR
jgi:hypothetical protein